jgi:two-component sensor histidine kinase
MSVYNKCSDIQPIPDQLMSRSSTLGASFDYPRVGATVRRLLADHRTGADVSVGPFLRDITDEISAFSEPGERTRITHRHANDSMVSAADAEPVGLIVGELVANAVHYAHPAGVPGCVNVSSTSAGDRLSSLEVKDDGVGLPVTFDCLVDGGAGLDAVRRLASQLGASLNFNDLGIGLLVRLDMAVAPGGRPKSSKAAS